MKKEIVEFLRKILPKNTSHQQVPPKINPSIIGEQTPRRSEEETVPIFTSTSAIGDDIYVDAKDSVVEIKNDDDDFSDVEGKVKFSVGSIMME